MSYVDGVVVFSPTFVEHLKEFRITPKRIRDARFAVNPGKVHLELCLSRVLVCVVDHIIVQSSEDKLKKLLKYSPSYNEKNFLGCLGILFFNYIFNNTCVYVLYCDGTMLTKDDSEAEACLLTK